MNARAEIIGKASLKREGFFFGRHAGWEMPTGEIVLHDRVELSIALRGRGTGSQAGYDSIIVARSLAGMRRAQRCPDIRRRIGSHVSSARREAAETGRHNANDGMGSAPQIDGTAHDGRIGMEDALPETVAEDCERGTIGHILLASEFAADERLDPEDVKIVGTDPLIGHGFHAAGGDQVDFASTAEDGAVQQRCVIPHKLPLKTVLTSLHIKGRSFTEDRRE